VTGCVLPEISYLLENQVSLNATCALRRLGERWPALATVKGTHAGVIWVEGRRTKLGWRDAVLGTLHSVAWDDRYKVTPSLMTDS
jgi:hypothetical protein